MGQIRHIIAQGLTLWGGNINIIMVLAHYPSVKYALIESLKLGTRENWD